MKDHLVGATLAVARAAARAAPTFGLYFILSIGQIHAREPHTFYGPVISRTQNPILLESIALIPTSSDTWPKGTHRISLQSVHSNIFERTTQASGTNIDLDMELWRTSLFWEYGLTDQLDLFVELPFLQSGTGFLDGFIQDYHDAFGFPNGGRDQVDNGRFAYTITQNGNVTETVSQANLVPSDGTIALKASLYRGDRFKLALQNLLKIPIGNPGSGGGNRHPDFAFSLIASSEWAWFKTTTQLGPTFSNGHPKLDAILETPSLQWIQSFEFKLLRPLSLVIQWQGSTSTFKDTNNIELSTPPLDLVIGFSGIAFEHGDDHLFFQVAFSEDPLGKGPSVDFSSYFRVGYQF